MRATEGAVARKPQSNATALPGVRNPGANAGRVTTLPAPELSLPRTDRPVAMTQDEGRYCLDTMPAFNSSKVLAVMHECNGGESQKWRYRDGQLENIQSGLCLDLSYSSVPGGGGVKMDACPSDRSPTAPGNWNHKKNWS